MLNPNNPCAQVIITLCGGQGGTPFDPVKRSESDTWQALKMAALGNLQLVSIGFFDIESFRNKVQDSYSSYGYRGKDKGFNIEKGVVHVFEVSRGPVCISEKSTPDQVKATNSKSVQQVNLYLYIFLQISSIQEVRKRKSFIIY